MFIQWLQTVKVKTLILLIYINSLPLNDLHVFIPLESCLTKLSLCLVWRDSKTLVSGLKSELFMPHVTKVPLDSLLQALVVQVGRGVRGFQGCQAHHLFLEVQDFPREKERGLFSLNQSKSEEDSKTGDNSVTQRSRTALSPSFDCADNCAGAQS